MVGNFNGWPIQYGQQAYQPMQSSQMYQPMKREIVRVSGKDGIKALQLNPLESVIAVDETESNVLWIKVMDSAGFPTLKKAHFEFEEETDDVIAPSDKYVSKKDFDELSAKFNKLMEELGNGKSDK